MHYFVTVSSIYVKNKRLLLYIFRFWKIQCCCCCCCCCC